jgi:hypothetical protein
LFLWQDIVVDKSEIITARGIEGGIPSDRYSRYRLDDSPHGKAGRERLDDISGRIAAVVVYND